MTDFSVFFNRHFEVLTSPGEKIRDEAFRLRYQVYCLEKGFERHDAFADRREHDEFDARSLHAIVKHRETDTTMATVRLVRRQLETSTADFPVEHHHPDLLERHGITNGVLPRQTTGEISRFAISKDYRRRVESIVPMGGGGRRRSTASAPGWRFNGHRYPLVTFGLFVALMRMSAMHGITHWLAIMEPSLLRLLSRFGVRFTPIGGLIDYHGRRQPCYGRVDRIRERVHGYQANLYNLVDHDIAHSLPRYTHIRHGVSSHTVIAHPRSHANAVPRL